MSEDENIQDMLRALRGGVQSVGGLTTMDQEDAVQTAAEKSLKKDGSFRGDAKKSTWWGRIGRNEALDIHRRADRREKNDNKFKDSPLPHSSPSAESEYTRIEETQALRMNIRELPNKYKQVMELKSQGYTDKEVSEELNIKEGTVRISSKRAIKKLRMMY